jgi:hypothetical protein
MNRKLWIIGDSFAGTYDDAWVKTISGKFDGNYQVSSYGSRDIQTIVDIFLRNLKNIKENDLVILTLPTLRRGRLPLENPTIDVELSNEYINVVDKQKYLDYFVGLGQYTPSNPQHILEQPLTGVSDKDLLSEDFKFNYNLLAIVHSSNAAKNNFQEMFKSFKSYFPFEIIIWSWTNEWDIPEVLTRAKIEEILGFWESHHSLFNESDGELGKKDDFHWSKKMNDAFAEYIIKSYPQYFDYESKTF